MYNHLLNRLFKSFEKVRSDGHMAVRCVLTWGHILHWYFLMPGP